MYKFSDDFKKILLMQSAMKGNAEISMIKTGPSTKGSMKGSVLDLSYMLATCLGNLGRRIVNDTHDTEFCEETLNAICESARLQMQEDNHESN